MLERPRAVIPAWWWWAGLLVIATIAGYLTILAYVEGLPQVFWIVPQFDKVVHFTVGGLLAFFLDGALRRRTLFRAFGLAFPLAAALVLVPAAFEEFLQRYATFRTSSIWDFVADLAGVVVLIPISRRVAR